MYATEVLKQEHRIIDRILPVISEAAVRLELGRSLDPDIFPKIMDFLSVFADQCHHGREESHFFPAMGEAGIETQSGLVWALKEEHKAMRTLVRKMAELWVNIREEESGARIAAATRSYARILPIHVEKEDSICFPMADEALTGEQQARLKADFEKIQSREPCLGAMDKYRDLVSELEERLELD